MAKCPNCGKDVPEPEKSFTNRHFHVEAYICKECHHHFHEVH
jgi:hypothetical protein